MSKFSFFFASATVFLTTAAHADFKRLTTEAEYRSAVAGKTVVTESSTVKIRKNGRLTGKTKGGDKITGAWAWRGQFWCRTVKVAGVDRGTDCQLVEVDGNKIRGTRNQGKGETFSGVIK